ncbi:MAG: SusE domain-containing protein [Bacteroidales bacterium]|nr:SusE domain-containing protein [Bacteroidales bacterium]
MKKLAYFIIALSGLIFYTACEEELRDPKLDMSKTVKSSILTPSSGSSLVLLKEYADSVLQFTWSAAKYDLGNLESTKYALQMDFAGNNFAEPIDLVSTTELSYETTMGQVNNQLLAVLELEPDIAYDFEYRVKAFLNTYSEYPVVYSDVITLSITPYSEIIYVKPIYLIGDATNIDWDNTIAIPMEHIGSGKFARVEFLDSAGDWFKFLSMLGAWAPQWGTDATGTLESGPLVYRPDEATPDPPSVPMGSTSGNYYIEADTLLLEYKTFLTSGELYLIGDATTAGWDNTAGLKLTEGPDHVFTITTTLSGSGSLKFLEVSGQWAPQWGTNEKGNSKKGLMLYRPTESVPDPPGIPSPSAGQYKITVDLTKMAYTIEAQ